jgi:branched-chain amino acid transport system permease protein
MDAQALIQFSLIGITVGSVYGLIGIGYTLTYNATEVINFAHGEFAMLGGMIAASLVILGLPLILAIVVAIAVVTLIAVVTEVATLDRFRGANPIAVILATLAFSVILRSIALLIWGKDPLVMQPFSGGALQVFGAVLQAQTLWVLGVALLAILALWWFYNKTAYGIAMIASSIDRDTATLMGINVRVVWAASFGISGGLGALAGILIAPLATTYYSIGILLGLKGFAAAATGSMRSAGGTFVAGLILGLLESYGAGYISSGYKDAISLGVALLILLVRPRGLFGGRRR